MPTIIPRMLALAIYFLSLIADIIFAFSIKNTLTLAQNWNLQKIILQVPKIDNYLLANLLPYIKALKTKPQ